MWTSHLHICGRFLRVRRARITECEALTLGLELGCRTGRHSLRLEMECGLRGARGRLFRCDGSSEPQVPRPRSPAWGGQQEGRPGRPGSGRVSRSCPPRSGSGPAVGKGLWHPLDAHRSRAGAARHRPASAGDKAGERAGVSFPAAGHRGRRTELTLLGTGPLTSAAPLS